MDLVSALVVAKNEENNLYDCLSSLKHTDEIVLILDKTTDKSKEIAEKFNCNINEGSWDNEGERRNFGIKKCKYEWIIEVDADERLSDGLIEEAKLAIKNLDLNITGYFLIPFNNYIGSKKILHGWGASWGVTHKPCLFHKNSKKWGKESIHPSLELGKKLGILKLPINHYIDNNLSDMIKRLDRYSSANAMQLRQSHKKLPNLAITMRRSITRFWKCYISRKGYKEGKWGFIIALFAALYIFFSYMKAELEDSSEKPKLK